MPPKGQADLAHPGAADWVLGTLAAAGAGEFQRHLTGCPHCQAAVAEFGQFGQILQELPPAAEPPLGLEARTLAGILAAAAEDRTPTRLQPRPAVPPITAGDQSSTQVVPIPTLPAAPDAEAPDAEAPDAEAPDAEAPDAEAPDAEAPGGEGIAKVIRFPRWTGRTGLLAVAGWAAAAVIAAVAFLPGLLGGGPAGAVAFTLASQSGASGTATARPDVSGSWDITLTVKHLRNLGNGPFYECWYVGATHKRVSAGTFVVGGDGSGTFSMTSEVDPTQFRRMEITAESSPSVSGATDAKIVLSGQGKPVA
jgi:anti-sigma factor RsiW